MQRMLWLYLDFYQLTINVLEQALGKDTAAPCVIYQAETNQIVQCTDSARALGIEVGMGMAQAASLVLGLIGVDSTMRAVGGLPLRERLIDRWAPYPGLIVFRKRVAWRAESDRGGGRMFGCFSASPGVAMGAVKVPR